MTSKKSPRNMEHRWAVMEIERVSTKEGLENLRPVWDELLSNSGSNTIALTWEWLHTWWEVFSEDRRLNVLLLREGGQLIAIAPLLKRTVRHFGFLSYTRIEFLACGEDIVDEICSVYLDFIILRGREGDALARLLQYLTLEDPDWDEIVLTNISSGSPNLDPLRELSARHGFRLETLRQEECLSLELPDHWDKYLASMGKKLRREFQGDLREAQEAGAELRVINTAVDFARNFDALVDLHQSRWTGRGEPGVFASERFSRFHRTLAQNILDKGWLTLFLLSVSGKPLSALYGFTHCGKLHFYQSGFRLAQPGEPGNRLRHPGTLIIGLAIRKAIEAGYREFDFHKIHAGGYKDRWKGTRRGIVQIRLARAQTREWVYSAASLILEHMRLFKRQLAKNFCMEL